MATDLSAIVDETDAWYALDTNFNSNAYVLAAAAWVDARKKIYAFDVSENLAITVAVGGGTDTLDDMKTLARGRVAGVWRRRRKRSLKRLWMSTR